MLTGRVVALLALLLPLLFLQLVWGQCASGNKDPHLNFAHGGTADFRGRDKTYYNFFSAPNASTAVLTTKSDFMQKGGEQTVHGSHLTAAYFTLRTNATGTIVKASLTAAITPWFAPITYVSLGGAKRQKVEQQVVQKRIDNKMQKAVVDYYKQKV